MVAHRFPPLVGGVETHCFEVGSRMARAGHTVTIITGDASGRLPAEEQVAGMRVLRARAYPAGSDILFAPGVYRHVQHTACDIVHVQGFHTFVPPVALLAAIRASRAFVMSFHSGGHSSAARRLVRGPQMQALKPLIVRAAKLIAVSEFEADHFAQGMRIERDRFVVVPNGAEIDAGGAQDAPDPENPLIVTLGRLERYKGHHRAIAALPYVLAQRPGARLRIVGDGPYRADLEKLAHRLGVADRVKIGGVPAHERASLGALISQAAAVVLLSDYEAHPVAALEAIALRRPVLASCTTGFREMAARGLVRGIDPASEPAVIAAEMLDLIDSGRSERTTQPATWNWNWDDCTGALLALYAQALGFRTQDIGEKAA